MKILKCKQCGYKIKVAKWQEKAIMSDSACKDGYICWSCRWQNYGNSQGIVDAEKRIAKRVGGDKMIRERIGKFEKLTIKVSRIKGKIIFHVPITDEKDKKLEARLILDLEQKINNLGYMRAHLGGSK